MYHLLRISTEPTKPICVYDKFFGSFAEILCEQASNVVTMSGDSEEPAGNMKIKPVHILLAVPVWMAISIAVPLGTTVTLIILSTLLICYFLLRILVSLERFRFDMRE